MSASVNKQIGLRGRRNGLSILSRLVLVFAVILAVAAVSLTASWPGQAEAKSEPVMHVVEIRQFKFFPANLTVNRGDRIEFKNLDIAPHTATAQGWDSGNLTRGQSWTLTADEAGTFDYICTYHPAMKGRITVR
ncbi:cupredoxin family copper-binding protein [uncultured Erythrobacter sp.]|uniref:cupredoxin domain-containing protein n=1 Tax=uncultured Erythrobacter sp. TaxID=263913 RepID=UPI002624DBFC|nr:cupredoxin family copper-binding protein [uncultured Erythrobacter sp.]